MQELIEAGKLEFDEASSEYHCDGTDEGTLENHNVQNVQSIQSVEEREASGSLAILGRVDRQKSKASTSV